MKESIFFRDPSGKKPFSVGHICDKVSAAKERRKYIT
jgi:hypothetical protein